MGKAKAKTSPATSSPSVAEPAVEKKDSGARFSELKAEAVKLFLAGEHARALEVNDQALQALPAGGSSGPRVEVLLNKASNYVKLNKHKEVIQECSNVLELQPNAPKALRWRAQALEQEGQFKAALADLQAFNKSDLATAQTRESERRLRDKVAPRPAPAAGAAAAAAAPAANGGTGSAAAAAAAAAARQRQLQQQRAAQQAALDSPSFPPQYFTAKISLGNDIRVVNIPPHGISYADMQQCVRTAFPNAGPLVLKCDALLVSSKADLDRALQELLHEFQAKLSVSKEPRALLQAGMPSLRVQAVPVASEDEVPKPPLEEMLARDPILAKERAARLQKERAEQQAAVTPTQQLVEVDSWLIDFANMFREMTGIDADRHLDMHGLGWEKCTRAMESTLESEKALALFDEAAEKFREVTCTGLLSWGNVFMCLGHRSLDDAAAKGKDLQAVRDEVLAQFDKAEVKYKEAMEYKADYFDGACALGQLEFERAKLRAGLLVAPMKATAESAPAEGAADASSDSPEATTTPDQAAALAVALGRLQQADVDAAQAHMDSSDQWFAKALEMLPSDEGKTAEAAGAAAAAGGTGEEAKPAAASPQPTEQQSTRSQGQIMHGNCLYEWSQVLAAVSSTSAAAGGTNGEAAGGTNGAASSSAWRAALDRAASLFRASGCAEADVRAALKNHTQAAHLDLGPDPEPAAPAAAQAPKAAAPDAVKAAEAEVKTPEVKEAKGLPALSRKK